MSNADIPPDLGDTLVDGVPHGAAASGKETAELTKDDTSGVHQRAKTVTWGATERRSDPLALLGTRLASRYELQGVLGTGGMGAVYRAYDTVAGAEVAIKILRAELGGNAEAIHRFLREARTTAALYHPNVVRIIAADLETDSGLLFLVMELLHGETAESALERRERFPLDEALAIAASVLRGLAAAHAAGIIHRDLKPANVFLTKDAIKLIDFGIAKSATLSGQVSLKLTTPGVVLGTPHYLSPEQARGETNLDQRVDIYALGVVLYELLSGQTPFDRPGYMQVLAAICRETPKPLRELVPDVPPEVEAIIAKAMARERDGRYASALEMLAAIDAVQATRALPEPVAFDHLTTDQDLPPQPEADEEPITAVAERPKTGPLPPPAAQEVPFEPASTLKGGLIAPIRPPVGLAAPAALEIEPTRDGLPAVEPPLETVASGRPPWPFVAAVLLGLGGIVMLLAAIW